MSIVSWELSDISVAKYGLDLKLPVWRAFKKIDNIYSIEGLNTLYNGFAKNADGNTVKNYFLRAYILARDVIRGSQGDEAAAKLFTDTYGYDIKSDIYTALKGLVIPDTSISRYILKAVEGPCYVIAGNDEPMFQPYYIIDPDQTGIDFFGNDDGVGVLNPETNKYEYRMVVTNVFTGTVMDYEMISRDEVLGASDRITFYTRDEVTVVVDPGLLKIEVLDYQGNVYSKGYIKARVYKFGMTPAEGYMPTDENDYIYLTDTNHSETLSHTSDKIMIKTPTTLGGQPLTVIGSTTFGYSDIIKAKIQEGVETIE